MTSIQVVKSTALVANNRGFQGQPCLVGVQTTLATAIPEFKPFTVWLNVFLTGHAEAKTSSIGDWSSRGKSDSFQAVQWWSREMKKKKNCLGSQLLHLNVFSSVNYSYQSCLKLLSMNIPPVPWHPLSFNHMLDKRLKLLFLNWVVSVLVNCFRVDFSFAMIFA